MEYEVVRCVKMQYCHKNNTYSMETEGKFSDYKSALLHKTYCESISNDITEYIIVVKE